MPAQQVLTQTMAHQGIEAALSRSMYP
jgi:hypothetical protein